MTNDPHNALIDARNFKFKTWFYNHHRAVFRALFEQPLNMTNKTGWKMLADSLPGLVVLNETIEEFDEYRENGRYSHRDTFVQNAMADDGLSEDEALALYAETFTIHPLWDWLEGIIDSDTADYVRPWFVQT